MTAILPTAPRRTPEPSARAPRTGVLLLNMGGPKTLDEVEPFLLRLFADREIISLPWQDVLGPFIAKRRAPKVRALYDAIGGGSPILKWTERQGAAMCRRLDELRPESGPHRAYVAFRYVAPFADDALRQMAADGIERVVVFTQYPQWSCTTTGSSLTDLADALARTGLGDRFTWSLIDRWPEHPGFVQAMAERVAEGLERFPAEVRDEVLIMYSAHSIPMYVVARGDAYPGEVAATVARVSEALGRPNPHLITWQSEVGPLPWLTPSTETTIELLAKQGRKDVLVVPIAFTSDHIETLSELDREYGELAHSLGMTGYRRAPALNDLPTFTDAMADIVHAHLESGQPHSKQYRARCPGCTNSRCRPDFNNVKGEGWRVEGEEQKGAQAVQLPV